MIHIALSIAAGISIAGTKTVPCGVVYCAAEAGEGVKARVKQAENNLKISGNSPFALLTVAPNLGERDGDTTELIKDIKSAENINQTQYKVVILDTLARVMAGFDENSTKDAGQFIKNAEHIARELNALVIVVHHAGKNSEKGMRGSSALLGAVDTVLKVTKREDYVWVNIEKQRDGSDELGFSFQLKTVESGKDQDGSSVTTCVLNNISSLQRSDSKSMNTKKTKNEAKFFDALDKCLISLGKEIELLDGAKVLAVDKSIAAEQFASFGQDLKKESSKRAFIRRLNAAISQHQVGIVNIDSNEMIWLLKK